MNVPIPPTIDLAPLANLKLPPRKRPVRTLALIGLANTVVTAGVLAWRIAPRVAARKYAKRRARWIAGATAVASMALAPWQLQRVFAAEPDYDVENSNGPVEIRRYAPMRIARTSVRSDWRRALNEGFGRLAHFIFGSNDEERRIRMTVPVLGLHESDGGYRIAFVTPKEITPPTPTDTRVTLDEIPARRVAVLRFNGPHEARRIEAKKRELLAAARAAGLEIRGEPSFAAYDPPTTLPVLRRNEVWVEVA